METIAAWLAGKVSGLIIFGLACLAVPMALWAITETVQLNGISVPVPFVGTVELVHGARADVVAANSARDKALASAADLRSQLSIAQGNEKLLQNTVLNQNASIMSLKAAADANQAAANERIEAAKKGRGAAEKAATSLLNHQIDTTSPASAAVDIDQLIRSAP